MEFSMQFFSEARLGAIELDLEMEACLGDANRCLNDINRTFKNYIDLPPHEKKFKFYTEAGVGDFFKGLYNKIKGFVVMLINSIIKVLNWFLGGFNAVFGTKLMITQIGKEKATANGAAEAAKNLNAADKAASATPTTSKMSGLLDKMYSGNMDMVRKVFDGETGFEFLGNIPVVDAIERIVTAGETKNLHNNTMVEEGIVDILQEILSKPAGKLKSMKDFITALVKDNTKFVSIKQDAENYRATITTTVNYKAVLQDIFTSKGMGASESKLMERFNKWIKESQDNSGSMKNAASAAITKLTSDLSPETMRDFLGGYFKNVEDVKYVTELHFSEFNDFRNLDINQKQTNSHIAMLISRIDALKKIVEGLEVDDITPIMEDMKINGYDKTPASIEEFKKNMQPIITGYVHDLANKASVMTKSGKPVIKKVNDTYVGTYDLDASKDANGKTASNLEVIKYTFGTMKLEEVISFKDNKFGSAARGTISNVYSEVTKNVNEAMKKIEGISKNMDKQNASAKPENSGSELAKSKELMFSIIKATSESVKHNVQQFLDIIKALECFSTLAEITSHNLVLIKAMFATYCALVLENYMDSMVVGYKDSATEEEATSMKEAYEKYVHGRGQFYQSLKLR